jgi:lysozyme
MYMAYSSAVRKRVPAFILMLMTLSGCALEPESAPTVSDHLTAGIFLDDSEFHHQLQALTPPPKLVKEGLELTESSEGWEARQYNDVAGFCTIGYGHLIKKSRCDRTGPENPEFLQPISPATGEQLLSRDMWAARHAVALMVTHTLNEYQFAALTDFVFNVGAANFKHSTLLSVLNESRFDEVGDQLKRWVVAGGRPVKGLEDRRFRDAELFYPGTDHQLRVVTPLPPVDIQVGENFVH